MKKYIIYSSILLLLVVSNVHAQVQILNLTTEEQDRQVKRHKRISQSIKDTMKIAEFIFEGTILKYDIYQSQPDNLPVCSEIVKVKNVYKGNLKPGTVEIIQFLSYPVRAKRITGKEDDSVRIFVCRMAKEFPYNPQNNIDKVDNAVILTEYDSSPFDGLVVTFRKNKIMWFDSTFKSKVALYDFLRDMYNVPIPRNIQTYQDSLEFGSEKEILYHHPEIVRWIDSIHHVINAQNQLVFQKLAHDSIESYNTIIIEKQQVENDLAKRKQTTKTFEYHWDAYLRKYVGAIVDHIN
jgi:hypothetical protein